MSYEDLTMTCGYVNIFDCFSTKWLTDTLTDTLTDILTYWYTDWYTDWLTDWLTDTPTDALTVFSILLILFHSTIYSYSSIQFSHSSRACTPTSCLFFKFLIMHLLTIFFDGTHRLWLSIRTVQSLLLEERIWRAAYPFKEKERKVPRWEVWMRNARKNKNRYVK